MTMARATRTLEAATAEAVRANPGYRAVSAMPSLDEGRPIVGDPPAQRHQLENRAWDPRPAFIEGVASDDEAE